MRLPACGSVLGVDVGFSLRRKSSAVCRLDWDADRLAWTIERFRFRDDERRAVVGRVAGGHALICAAFDGPLAPGLDPVARYRMAERMLTRGFGPLIGKPGSSNVPIGRALNAAAIAAARLVLEVATVDAAHHRVAIHERAVVEAFPSAYLGMMVGEPGTIAVTRRDRSDRYFEALAGEGVLDGLLGHLLPGRAHAACATLRNHDDRAAFVCALTALGVASGEYLAVGDPDGWIILPPPGFVQPWVGRLLRANAATCGADLVIAG